jgi:hypothetical protein
VWLYRTESLNKRLWFLLFTAALVLSTVGLHFKETGSNVNMHQNCGFTSGFLRSRFGHQTCLIFGVEGKWRKLHEKERHDLDVFFTRCYDDPGRTRDMY